MGERLASRLSPRSRWLESAGGPPEHTDADIAAALGGLDSVVHKLMLGAKYCGWAKEQDQLHDMALRHSWSRWHDKRRPGDMSVQLNERLVDLALMEWQQADRSKITGSGRAKLLQVGYRRYASELQQHYEDLLGWLDTESANGMAALNRALKGLPE